MNTASNTPSYRLALLAVIALLLVMIVGRKMIDPDPASALTSSPSTSYHLVPTEKANDTKLILFDGKSRHLLVFEVQNSGLRLNGWRDVSNDYRVWDSSLVKSNGMETTTGASCQYLMPDPKNPKQGSLVKNMEDWLANSKPPIPIKIDGTGK